MQYVANSGEVTLAAGTAKTVLMIKSTAIVSGQVIEVSVDFNGVVSSNEPVLVELVKSTNATNSTPGTGNTEVKPMQTRGAANTGGEGAASTMTAFAACTSEPTVLKTAKAWWVSPTSGLLYQSPLGRELEIPAAASPFVGIGLRLKAAQEVKVTAYLEFIQGPS